MQGRMTDEELGGLLEGSERIGEPQLEDRERLRRAREGLALAHEADVPEPPRGYWESFPARVDNRLSRERRGGAAWLAAAAATLLALASLVPSQTTRGNGEEWTALPVRERDAGWLVLAGLDSELRQLEPMAEGTVEEGLLGLSEHEQGELARLIADELSGRES